MSKHYLVDNIYVITVGDEWQKVEEGDRFRIYMENEKERMILALSNYNGEGKKPPITEIEAIVDDMFADLGEEYEPCKDKEVTSSYIYQGFKHGDDYEYYLFTVVDSVDGNHLLINLHLMDGLCDYNPDRKDLLIGIMTSIEILS